MHSSVVWRRSVRLAQTGIASLVFCAPVAAIAQNSSMGSEGIGVARVSLIDGNVAVQRGDSAEPLAAALNAPVLGGDYITTGDRSRTEIEFDGSSQLRLGPGSQLRFTHLDTGDRTLQLAAGTLELRLLRDSDGTSEIDTPSISIKPQQRGAYRVTVTSDGQTLVTVRSGQAEIDTPRGAQDLQPGSTFIAQGDATDPSTQTVAATAPDEFDTFNAERDRVHARALTDSAFVNADIGGVEDLAGNGRWVTDGSYGHVWIPASVGPDWAPYRNGRWVWEDGYGWTWVGAEPWGWAPYHYGSWYHSPNYGWCWYPPQPQVFSPWRPALVAFIGFGEGAGFSLGFGSGNTFENVGWVPLAPYEPYHPWWRNRYGGNTTIINNNITNITNITNNTNVTDVNVYRNVRYNAVSSVTSQRFLQGNFTRNTAISRAELRHATVFRSTLPIVPTASNLRFTSTAQRSTIAIRPAIMGQSFAGNTNVVHRTAFEAQRIALSTATRAPITPLHFTDAHTTPIVQPRTLTNEVGPGRTNFTPAAPAVRAVTPALPLPAHRFSSADPWARFNQSRAIVPTRPAGVPAPTVRGTYHPPVPPPASKSPNNVSVPGNPNTYHAPMNANGDRAPGNPNTYHAPMNANGDRAPGNPNTYRAPMNANGDRVPANPNTYHAPMNANGIHSAPQMSGSHEPAGTTRPRSFDERAAGQHDAQPNRLPMQGAPPPHAPEQPPHATTPDRHEAPRTTEQTHPAHPPSRSQ